MRYLAYRDGGIVAAGRVGAGSYVVVVTVLVAGAAAVGWAMRGPGCVCSFDGAGSNARHTLGVLGHLETLVGSAPA